MDNKKIGLFITNLRKEKNMTQKQLAIKLYVSDKAVSKWERGICMPDIALIEKLSKILDVNVSDILKGEKIKKMTKESSDEIMRDSIPFFQKAYLKNKVLKIFIYLSIVLPLIYLITMVVGEFNHGKVVLGIWGNGAEIEVNTFTRIKAKNSTTAYLKAFQEEDYEIMREMYKEIEIWEYGYIIDWITFEEYKENIQVIKDAEVKLEKFKFLYCYTAYYESDYSLEYICGYDSTFTHEGINYKMAIELKYSGGKVSTHRVAIHSKNIYYWNNLKSDGKEYKSIYKMENKELLKNIEIVFSRYY